MSANNDVKIIVALDYSDAKSAMALAEELDPTKCHLKIGKELFTRAGPAIVEQVRKLGFEVFLDLKFHDIPNTCAQAVRAAADLGVWMVNVHASGGRAMMEAAREAIDHCGSDRPLLIGVTVLTSLEEDDLRAVGFAESPRQLVSRLAGLADDCGLDGVVCSSREVRMLREQRGTDFLLVTPGIRPAGSARDDQKRVMSPVQALREGSSFLVIGRPITQSPSPLAALEEMTRSLSAET